MNLLIYLILGIVITAVLILLFKIYQRTQKDNSQDTAVQTLNQRLDGLNVSMNQALRETVKMVADQLKDNRESVERSSRNANQQIQSFTSGLTQLSENVKEVRESVKNVSAFQDIFRSPKLRGIWGESSLEASLSQYFSKDNYELQYYFKSGEAVDAILKLPNDLLLPIDSKFNWENFEKMVNADNDIQKDQHRKTFYSDVKKKIDEISLKYILPSEGTTDFALMYVPAETVYYEIISNTKEVDVPAYARSKKIILVSPNTFFLSVSSIRHWVKDIQLNKQTKDIMKRLDVIAKDGNKLAEDFEKLGKHISNAHGSYESADKRLGLLVDRVQNVIDIDGTEKKQDSLLN